LHPPGASRLVSNASPEDNGLAFTVAVSTRASWQLWPVCSAPSQRRVSSSAAPGTA